MENQNRKNIINKLKFQNSHKKFTLILKFNIVYIFYSLIFFQFKFCIKIYFCYKMNANNLPRDYVI